MCNPPLHRGSNCPLVHVIDGRTMRCRTISTEYDILTLHRAISISSCQSSAISQSANGLLITSDDSCEKRCSKSLCLYVVMTRECGCVNASGRVWLSVCPVRDLAIENINLTSS